MAFQDLVKALNSVLKSHYKNAALALLMTPAQYDAHELKQAMKVMHSNLGMKRFINWIFS